MSLALQHRAVVHNWIWTNVLIFNQVVWICLAVVKDNVDGWTHDIVDT